MTVQTGYAFNPQPMFNSSSPVEPGAFFLPVGSFASFSLTFTSVTAQGDLAATPDLARWTPVVASFACPAGYKVLVVAQIGTDSALWMVAYDELLGGAVPGHPEYGLSPLFEDKSTVTVAGSELEGRTFTFSILPNGGWQRPNVKLVVYCALEVTP